MPTWSQRIKNLMNKIKPEKQQFAKMAFPDGQPEAIRSFLSRFEPKNEKEAALFDQMMKAGKLDNVSLAQIGDEALLRYLWQERPISPYYDLRTYILENPCCPKDLVLQGLQINDWEVRLAAAQRPDAPTEALVRRARREASPAVKKALRERLGSLYPLSPVETVAEGIQKEASLRAETAEHSMQIVGSFNGDAHSMVYTVELEPGFMVDVKACAETGLVYVMQNEDGSTVYDPACADYTYPDYEYDEDAVVQLVKKEISHARLDDLISEAQEKSDPGRPAPVTDRAPER